MHILSCLWRGSTSGMDGGLPLYRVKYSCCSWLKHTDSEGLLCNWWGENTSSLPLDCFGEIWIDRSLVIWFAAASNRLLWIFSQRHQRFQLITFLPSKPCVWPQHLHFGTHYLGILMRAPCTLQPLPLSSLPIVLKMPQIKGMKRLHSYRELIPGVHIYEGTNGQPEWVCGDGAGLALCGESIFPIGLPHLLSLSMHGRRYNEKAADSPHLFLSATRTLGSALSTSNLFVFMTVALASAGDMFLRSSPELFCITIWLLLKLLSQSGHSVSERPLPPKEAKWRERRNLITVIFC